MKDIDACCRRSHTARAVDHFFKHGADRLGHIETAGEHETRQQDVGNCTTAAAQSRHEDLVAQTGLAHRSAVSRPERHRTRARRTIRSRELDVSAASHVGVDGQRAGPYDGHGRYTAWTPSRVQGQMSRGEGSSRSGTPHPREIVGASANASVVKEHGREPRLHAQEVRPSTALLVNEPRFCQSSTLASASSVLARFPSMYAEIAADLGAPGPQFVAN